MSSRGTGIGEQVMSFPWRIICCIKKVRRMIFLACLDARMDDLPLLGSLP